ncbi:MAG: glycosyltransferase family 2 protein [Ferrimicrobium sp.]
MKTTKKGRHSERKSDATFDSTLYTLSTNRQIGSDRRRHPLPSVPNGITESKVVLARLAIIATVVGWIGYLIVWFWTQFLKGEAYSTKAKFEAIMYLFIVSLLLYSSLSYLVSRLGYLYRSRQHRRVPRAVIDEFFASKRPTLNVIVPSYREETRIVRSTLLSVALQEYPDIEIALLIDDPPNPSEARNQALLAGSRSLPKDIERLLEYPATRFREAIAAFRQSSASGPLDADDALEQLAQHYDFAVFWSQLQATELPIIDHTDVFLKEQVFERLSADFSLTAAALRSASGAGQEINISRLDQLYQRLVNTFSVKLYSFERKQYASLSHEPNKAMNLNSFIGLLGGSYCEVETLSGKVLVPADPDTADLVLRDPDYVLTLDADSVLLPEYCLRLVYLLEQSEYEKVAVAQTPYSAFPGSATRLERVAGATTDLQHIVHQGLTHYDASFWVGANAIIRKQALDDVCEVDHEGGYRVKRYVRDRTAIEDTESSIDLAAHGWMIYNYPERLSYSATPPDFGSLCIQRRRWADGGLIIVPKLHRKFKAVKARGERGRPGEYLLRFNYLASIAWSSSALILLLIFPFANQLVSPWIAVLALPYFAAMASDLHSCGYRRSDIARIYGFNLILIPVNLAGTANSLVQAITGEKGVFGRTPKIRERTVAPLLFVITPYLILALAGYTLVHDYYQGLYNNFLFAVINLTLAAYAVIAYIGLRDSVQDFWVQIKPWFWKRQRRREKVRPLVPSAVIAEPRVTNWAAVLHYGSSEYLLDSTSLEQQGGRLPSPLTKASLELASPIHALGEGEGSPADVTHEPPEIRPFLQPVFDLANHKVIGFEALTRIDGDLGVAEVLGSLPRPMALSYETEIIRVALQSSEFMPEDCWLSVNVSHQFLRHGDTSVLILESDTAAHLIVEISASDSSGEVIDRDHLEQLITRIPGGTRVALDDTIPEYRFLAMLAELKPAVVKVDSSWVREIESNSIHQALVEVTVRFARENGSLLVAEGIESKAELMTLQSLGVRFGQGFLLGTPLPASVEQVASVITPSNEFSAS